MLCNLILISMGENMRENRPSCDLGTGYDERRVGGGNER